MDETMKVTAAQEEALLLGNTLICIAQYSEDADTVRQAVTALARTSVGMQILHTNPLI